LQILNLVVIEADNIRYNLNISVGGIPTTPWWIKRIPINKAMDQNPTITMVQQDIFAAAALAANSRQLTTNLEFLAVTSHIYVTTPYTNFFQARTAAATSDTVASILKALDAKACISPR